MPQMSKVNCTYGAPMGRPKRPHNFNPCVNEDGKILHSGETVARFRLFRVNLDSGGYDDGGAYWGFGLPLYCLRGETDEAEVEQFVRAKSRQEAKEYFHSIEPGIVFAR